MRNLTRRDFLRLSRVGMFSILGLTIPPYGSMLRRLDKFNSPVSGLIDKQSLLYPPVELNPAQQGRVLTTHLDVYDIPSYSGKRVNKYWIDSVLPLTGITIGKSEDSFNMIWYKVGTEGYVHSGDIQPVMTITNPVIENIPEGGIAAEVTVPYTDARWDPGEDKPVAYRYYFATTYWVTEFLRDDMGNPWYGVRDDKWEYMFYAPSTHLRLIPPEEMKPISPGVPPGKKRIEVHLPEQVLIAYEYDQPIFVARVATGAVFSNGDYSTPPGQYITFQKRASRHMARGNLAANGYDLPGVPWNSYITEEGIAFHGTYWHNNFGRPRSHGCINLTPQAARWVYLWTEPVAPPDQEWVYEDFGTNVDIIA